MAVYIPDSVPSSVEALLSWLPPELNKVAAATNQPEVESLNLSKLAAAPARPRDGTVVYADGTNWNPGGGEGFYGYYAGAWNRLG